VRSKIEAWADRLNALDHIGRTLGVTERETELDAVIREMYEHVGVYERPHSGLPPQRKAAGEGGEAR
jgi:hypothetical protein